MTSQEFLKWLEQCSMDLWLYQISSSGPQVGAVQVEKTEMNAEPFKRPTRNPRRRPAGARRYALGRSRPANVA